MDEKGILKLSEGLGWVSKYMQYTLQTEAPAHFHLLQALTLWGAALGRKVYFTHGVFKIYPNLFALLVAPSGRCRKSTAIRLSLDVLTKAAIENVRLVGPKATPEAIIQAAFREEPKMEGGKIVKSHPDSVTIVFAPELAVLLNQRDFNKDTVPLLTDLYDCPDKWTNATITRGTVNLYNVFVSTMFASTPQWLIELMPRSAFGGGFMGRVIAAVREKSDRCFPEPPPPDPQLQTEVVEGLVHAYNLGGECGWGTGTKEVFRDWYMDTKKDRETSLDDRESGYKERKPVNLIKVAMILTTSQGRLSIEETDLRRGLEILSAFEEDMFTLYRSLGDTEFKSFDANAFQQLKNYIEYKDILTQHDAIRHMVHKGFTASKTRELLSSLQDASIIEIRRAHGQVIVKRIYPKDEGKPAL